MIPPFKVRGYEIALTREGRDYDVRLTKGALVVVGMYDAGGLTLSEHTPAGERVRISDATVDEIEEQIGEVIAEGEDEEEAP
jgi:hypothetical protein